MTPRSMMDETGEYGEAAAYDPTVRIEVEARLTAELEREKAVDNGDVRAL